VCSGGRNDIGNELLILFWRVGVESGDHPPLSLFPEPRDAGGGDRPCRIGEEGDDDDDAAAHVFRLTEREDAEAEEEERNSA
jgi:hypothetical protein